MVVMSLYFAMLKPMLQRMIQLTQQKDQQQQTRLYAAPKGLRCIAFLQHCRKYTTKEESEINIFVRFEEICKHPRPYGLF
ncbi:MAG: hypothetical protein D6772_00835 [Bacteroidetes bacterium]|nr:MAG: hypothetical protein D6772_00835 [Bacteroidota bacterium]